jgi:hypothetical protein
MPFDHTQVTDAPSIAVVVATHQAERHLATQLQSLTEQTERPTSVIVSDAGSTDRTVQIAEEFADRAPFPPLTLEPWGGFAPFTMTFRRALLDVIAFDRRVPGLAYPERTMQAEHWIYFLASCLGDTALRTAPLALHRQNGVPGPCALWLRVVAAVERQRTLRLASERRCAVARARATLLVEATESAHSDDTQRPLLESAARHWTQVARCEENRLALYHKPSLEQRFDKLLHNVADGTYRQVPRGTFRHTELARDLLSLWVPP